MSKDEGKIDAPTLLKRRFGSVLGRTVDELASVLSKFSLDLVGLCASYLSFGVALPGLEPVCLHRFTHHGPPGSERRFDWCCFSVAQAPDGCIWIGDDKTVSVFSADYKFVKRLDETHFKNTISSICFDDGRAFVCNYAGYDIIVTDLQGNVQTSFSVKGERFDRAYERPWGIVADGNGALYISESNHSLHIFTRDGKPKHVTARPNVASKVATTHAGSLTFNKYTNELFLTDSGGGMIQAYDLQGTFLREFGRRKPDWKPGDFDTKFDCAVPIATDHSGNLLIGDSSNKIHVLKTDGTLVTSFGEKCGFDRPRALCVCDDGRILVGCFSCVVQVLAFTDG